MTTENQFLENNLLESNLSVNDKNHLTFAGLDAVSLANEFGTPLYVMDEDKIRENCQTYKNAVSKYYPGGGLVLYASKAFSAKEIYRIVASEGLGVDVVSGGELYTALSAGFPAEKIYFHGNNKTRDEIVYAIKSGVGRLVVDNSAEIDEIDEVSKELGVNTKILFRIKPGIDAHTHNFIMTGQIDSKFGVALETGEAKALVEDALLHKNITLVGVHCHIGSQIFELDPFRQAAKVMVNFMADMKDAFGVTLTELNLGGGFGIKYTQADTPVPFEAFIQAVHEQVAKTAGERGVDVPFILMEPGRSIVGPSGITLYTVGGKKVIPGVRTYVSVDGGMCDNPRYILYASEYEGAVANRAGDEKTEVVTVAGRCCESGDILMQDAKLQPAQKGDTLAVFATGAYNYSMASNYNRLPKPAVVMVKDKKARLVVRRETYEDLVKNDI